MTIDTTLYKQIQDIIFEAQERRLAEEGCNPPIASYENTRAYLLGCCDENAAVLADVLRKNGLGDVWIAKGGLKIDGEPTPTSLEMALDYGTVHYWVVLEHEEKQIHCDACRETKTRPGDWLITQELPSEYILFNLVKPETFDHP